jgi:hypothetical protein
MQGHTGKLTIHRETLRRLDAVQLGQVGSGSADLGGGSGTVAPDQTRAPACPTWGSTQKCPVPLTSACG